MQKETLKKDSKDLKKRINKRPVKKMYSRDVSKRD